MKQILIDKFLVPQEAIEEFTNRMNYNRNFIKDIAGFLGDSVYKRMDENGKYVIITVAEWKDENSIVNARETVQSEYKRTGFNLPELLARLNITMERGIYQEFNVN
jgi:heme-degrading monooxygenase HmoA